MTATPNFKEKCRQLMFNSGLKQFPVIFEMYVATFNIELVDMDAAMAEIIRIVRTSENADVANSLVEHFLDALEKLG